MANMGEHLGLVARNFLIPEFSSAQEALAFLAKSAEYLTVSKYFTYAFFALLIYDHMLTMPEEAKIVWLGRPSFVKALFLFNRYFVPLFIAIDIGTLSGGFHLTDKLCRTWLITDEIFEFFSLISTTLIITFRVHAVLGGNIRAMLPSLLGIWAGQALISAILVIVQVTVKGSRTIVAEPNFGVCIADIKLDKWWLVWIPSMAFHTLVFGLLVWKAFSTPREAQTPMLMLLIRDGILYFGVVFAAFLFNLLIWAVAPVTLAILPHDSVWCITTMALSRLMLSMKKISAKMDSGEDEETNGVTRPVSPATRPMSVATIPLSVRRNLERKIASLKGAPVGSPHPRSHTPQSLAETVFLDTWGLSPQTHSRRSSRNSVEDTEYQMPTRRQSQSLPSDSPSTTNAAWYPGAISESRAGYHDDPQIPFTAALRSRSPTPLMYVRPLPPIPTGVVGRPSGEMTTSNSLAVPHTRTRSASSVSSLKAQSRPKSHQVSASTSSINMNTTHKQSTINDAQGLPHSNSPSGTNLALHSSGATVLSHPEVSKADTINNFPRVSSEEARSGVRVLPPRPPIASFGPSDAQLWTDSAWQELTTHPRLSYRETIDRKGEAKRSDSGGSEL